MKTNILTILLLTSLGIPNLSVRGQATAPKTPDDALSRLPAIELREDGPQSYTFITDYISLDLAGNITGRQRVSGDYTRGLPDNKVRWNNVRVAASGKAEGAFSKGEPQKYMEGFSYESGTPDQFKDSFFAGFPAGATSMQMKNLVWDITMFETFARGSFDKLKLNEPFELDPSTVPLAGAGEFSNRRPMLTWVGVSKMNGKLCALIQYEVFLNKFKLPAGAQIMNGRSDYWGTIWVSLEDKQIEKETLNESVLMTMPLPGKTKPQLVPVFRQATLRRR